MANYPWFRMYSEFATDPKVQKLSESYQRRFVMLLCMRCSNGCVTLHDEDVAFQLRISDAEWLETKTVFILKNLSDNDNNIIAWDKRQYISDSSATRVAKHRAKRKDSGMTSQDWIKETVRKAVFKRCGNICCYCGSDDNLTLDHMTPTSRGGSNEDDNLQVACRVCNADKRNMTHDEYSNWNGRVTLQKRPQITDTDTDTDIKKTKKERIKKIESTFMEFIDQCKTKEERPVRNYSPLWAYVETAGIPEDFINLAWVEFSRIMKQTDPPKKYKDWRKAFKIYIEKNYLKLWAITREGEYFLTNEGKQAELFHNKDVRS